MVETRGTGGEWQVSVRYYKRMRRGKVYPTIVRWAQQRRAGHKVPVTVRLLVGGAQVVPAELPLDTGDPNAQATFYVTPLARGWLRGEQLEVVVNDKKIAEARLPARVTSQRLTWILFLLTFLVPLYVAPLFTTAPFDFQPVDVQTGQRLVNARGQTVEMSSSLPGTKLSAWLLYLEDKYCPSVPGWLRALTPPSESNEGYEVLVKKWTEQDEAKRTYTTWSTAVPEMLGNYYDVIFFQVKDWPLALWSGVVLLLLTLLSLFWHRERRGRRTTKAFALG